MGGTKASGGIGYVLRKFPVFSETFVLGEMLALEARGVPLHVFSLERPNDPRFHDDLPRLKARVTYVPDLFDLKRLRDHNSRIRRSRAKAYYGTLIHAVSRAGPKLLWRFLQAGFIANEARRLGLRHLHVHFANRPATVAFLASRIAGIPYSFTAHAMDIFKEQVDQDALAAKIREARFVVTVSDFNKRYLENVAKDAAEKIVRIYNGIDLERFAPNGQQPSSPFTILSVARLVEKKGLPVLIEACRHLRDRGVEHRCWIVGKGRARPHLEDLIERWGLQGIVRLLGPLTQLEVLKRYRSAHLYALPCVVSADGNRDGLPVSIVEALACGLPVVTTPVTGIPEAVEDGRNGLIIPEGDAIALADAIERASEDQELYARLREGARPSVETKFDRRQTVEVLHRLFEGASP